MNYHVGKATGPRVMKSETSRWLNKKHLERTNQYLRLVNGTQLVQFVLDYYEALDAEWKLLLPLRRVPPLAAERPRQRAPHRTRASATRAPT